MMDTRIDFKTAKKFDQLELVDWKTRYADFKFYVRRGLNEIKYNIGTNISKGAKSGEYIKPFTSKTYGKALNIDEILNRDDVWLDIGGHMGFFAIRMAKQFPNIKKIISYEALPHNVSFALENINLNQVEQSCEVIQKAIIPGTSESIEFFISSDSGKHSILQIKGRDVISVPAININDAIKQHGATAIKMDVEGAEYELLKAVTDWSSVCLMIVEYHFMYKPLKKNRAQKFQEIIGLLQPHFDVIRKIDAVEHGKNFVTHFVAMKSDKKSV